MKNKRITLRVSKADWQKLHDKATAAGLTLTDYIKALTEAFEELTDKEQDVIGMHLGFCHNCFRIVDVKTYDEIADVYQFATEDGVRRFYQRTLEKMRQLLAKHNLFVSFSGKQIDKQ